MLAHLGSTVTTRNIVMPKVQQRLPEFIDDTTLQALFRELGSDPVKDDGRPSRDWLIVYLALLTGMRRSEICALTVHQFRGLHATEENPARLALTVTKGSKPRTVAIDAFLLERVLAYADGERKTVLRQARSKGRFRHREPIELFLNGPYCADKYLGNPVTPDMVDRIFLRAQRKVLGELTKGHSFHHLRHTHVMRRRLAGDEWENISRDVGHAQIGTTINTYARALTQVEPDVRAKFVRALRLLAEGET
jgi:integrase